MSFFDSFQPLKHTIWSLVWAITISCGSMDCSQLPSSFSSYREGLLRVEQASFPINDRVDTSRSSWIRSASYHSCGDGFGFMVMITDSRSYLHQGMPVEEWEDFKKARSFGSHYNRHIKGRYQLQLH